MSNDKVKKAQLTVDSFFKNSKFNRLKDQGRVIPAPKPSKSILSSSNDDGFDEPEETSFDTSTEVINLRSSFLTSQTTTTTSTNTNSRQSKRKVEDILDFQPKRLKKQSPPPQVETDEKVELSPEQEKVIDLVINKKKNVFFTGSAGTGKSVLLKELAKKLKEIYGEAFGLTASTGLAACNIGGMTLHGYLSIGIGNQSVEAMAKKIIKNTRSDYKWNTMKVLIIDEVSMIDGLLLDKINIIARMVRKNNKPFGGIQVVFCGDFYQLPPVAKDGKYMFAFESKAWKELSLCNVVLLQVFRQKGDSLLIKMLNEMRLGNVSDECYELFKSLQRPLKLPEGIAATELFATRNEVDAANKRKLQSLDGETRTFEAVDTYSIPSYVAEQLSNGFMAPQKLELKIGANVMCIKNMETDIVNGSIGKVIDFMSKGDYLTQLAETDLPINTNTKKYPLVQFMVEGSTPKQILVQEEEWLIEDGKGNPLITRVQLPLMVLYALTIHKSQGQSIPYVVVDFRRIFESGHAYVALSRAINRDGLQIVSFNPRKIIANPRVLKFYKSIGN